jgi:hypothetical protein
MVNSPNSDRMQVDPQLDQLRKVQMIMQIETSLTQVMEKVEPWLVHSNVNSATSSLPRVRPIPTNMKETNSILAVARNLSARTSAPAGWNPSAPVMGFSTPNPLPHQLRGGALAALQWERARQAEQEKKKRQREQEIESKQHFDEPQRTDDAGTVDPSSPNRGDQQQDPKRREVLQQHQQRQVAPNHAQQQQQAQLSTPAKLQEVSMNLSDSSSDDDEDSN